MANWIYVWPWTGLKIDDNSSSWTSVYSSSKIEEELLKKLDDVNWVEDNIVLFDTNWIKDSGRKVGEFAPAWHQHNAANINVDTTNFGWFLNDTVTNFQLLADYIDDNWNTATWMLVNTTNFDWILSAADNTVQKALDTIDDASLWDMLKAVYDPAWWNKQVAFDDEKQDILAEWAFVDWDKTKLDWIEAWAKGWDVVWPASAVDENIAVFDTTTWKLIKDWGKKVSDLALLDWATFTGQVNTPSIAVWDSTTLSASVNGNVSTAKAWIWVDDWGFSNPVIWYWKAEDTVAWAWVAQFSARSRWTLASPTIVQDWDVLASNIACWFDWTDFAISSRIDHEVDWTPWTDDMPWAISFKVSPDWSQIPAEAMRISQDKNVTMEWDLDVTWDISANNLSWTNTWDQDLSWLALKTNVLELDNTTPFTPDADYEPATKKYVDDNAWGWGWSVTTLWGTTIYWNLPDTEQVIASYYATQDWTTTNFTYDADIISTWSDATIVVKKDGVSIWTITITNWTSTWTLTVSSTFVRWNKFTFHWTWWSSVAGGNYTLWMNITS